MRWVDAAVIGVGGESSRTTSGWKRVFRTPYARRSRAGRLETECGELHVDEAVTRVLYADEGWRPAGPVPRLVATILDMAVYCGLCLLLAIPVERTFDWSALWGGIDEIARAVSDPAWLGHASSILGLWIALWWCYFVVGWGFFGATPGKWAMGLRIVDYRQRCPIGPARAALRLAAYCVSSLAFEWGQLVILIRNDRRALQDVLAGTRVVRRSKPARGGGHEESDSTPTNEETDGDSEISDEES